jgi:hypothetical protein
MTRAKSGTIEPPSDFDAPKSMESMGSFESTPTSTTENLSPSVSSERPTPSIQPIKPPR